MLKGSTFEPDLGKLQRLIHYVCHRKRDNPSQLGRLKLHKILFYSDLHVFLLKGQPITGEVYIKHQYGPFSTHLNEAVAALEGEEKLVVSVEPYRYGAEERSHHLFFSRQEPDINDFAAHEISVVDRYIEVISPHSATVISEASHDIVWKSRSIGETIPYYSGFLYTLGEIRPEDLEWAQEELTQWDQSNEDQSG